MLDRFIELVFKYRPVVFEQGELGFSPPWPAAIAVIVVFAAMGAAVWVYLRAGRTRGWSRAALLALRLSALAVFLFALLRPVLIVRTVEPQRNVLALLVDGSRSMEIADLDAKPRSAFVREAIGPAGALRAALARRFSIRDFEFASTARRVADPAAMTFSGTRSFIGRSLQRTAEELSGLPVSGIVLVTDGADTSREPMSRHDPRTEIGRAPGVRRRARPRDARQGRPDRPRRSARHRAEGRHAGGRRRRQPVGIRRPPRAAHRRRRGPGDRVAGGDASAGRRAVHGARALHAGRARPARAHLPCRRAGRRAGDAEQRAPGAGHGEGPARAPALRGGRAALRDEVPAPGRGRRRQSSGGDAAAHG